MIKEVRFKNYKVLRDAVLPLGPFTLIVGPNGSGKSATLRALSSFVGRESLQAEIGVAPRSVGAPENDRVLVEVVWGSPHEDLVTRTSWLRGFNCTVETISVQGQSISGNLETSLLGQLTNGVRTYSLNPERLHSPSALRPTIRLQEDGSDLAGALDTLRDSAPEQFEKFNKELPIWFPDFDRVLFRTPDSGQRSLLLRMRGRSEAIPARELSQGTLLALALLSLAYLQEPLRVVGIEEPDRGLHPRLLRQVQDALYRLSYPEQFGESREPVQVIATTHSPYFLDLYRDHPDEVVISQKDSSYARFERLSDRPDIQDLVGDAPLGEIWYSGILGGVPAIP